MNDVIRTLLQLSVASLEAAELDEHTSSTYRRLHQDVDEFDSAATAFIAHVSAVALETDTAEDFTAFIDALAANASLTNDNRSSDGSDGNTFEDSDSDFTTALNSTSNDENVSISFDQDVGSSSSSSNELEIESDANLAAQNLPIGLATTRDTSNFLVLLTISLILEMATSHQQ
ncbi:hypothetical protein DVH05_002600 [Phytophthora capsici]|nr:hypothetical protein DVH05_002600 [Phytophthora capsici]